MTVRLPLLSEAEALAAHLEAKGYPPAEAAANFRFAFGRGEALTDGALMFEGPTIREAERWADEWAGVADDDDALDALGSWLNAVTFCAFLTLAAKAGETDALRVRAEDIAFCAEHWKA